MGRRARIGGAKQVRREQGDTGEAEHRDRKKDNFEENPNDAATKEFYKKFQAKYGIYPKEHEVEGYAVIYIIADALKRAQLTGNLDADREAIRQSLLKTDMTTIFGKVKFGNWAGPLGDKYTNQNVHSSDHSVLAQWLDGKLLNVWQKVNAETNAVFPDNTVKR